MDGLVLSVVTFSVVVVVVGGGVVDVGRVVFVEYRGCWCI